MHSYNMLFRGALLSSALAIVAFAPAGAASLSEADKRIRAAGGNHAFTQHESIRAVTRQRPGKSSYTDLHDFAGSPGDGASPSANVALDDQGNIYGTTDYGGANGDGTVFKLDPKGNETLLHSFSGTDGTAPDGAVTVLPNGNLYGTTSSGGSSDNGVLFSLTAKGKFKVLHNFSSTDGSAVRGDLVTDQKGNLYGTALFGGSGSSGTVFEYSSKGKFTVLHAFNGTTDGEYPEHGVVRDAAGNLYGATAFGPGIDGQGTVYKIATDGTFSTVYNFTGGADGGFLYGGLDVDKDGNVYGSTAEGGANDAGTVFKLTPDGTLTTLYNFTGGADGDGPKGDTLVVGKNIYGTTDGGGDPDCLCGVVYEVTAKGKEKVLHAFTSSTGGGYSAGVISSNNALYGTTSSFGAHDNGVVFSISKK